MTPYCKRYIPDEEIEIFERIKKAVNNLRDIDLGLDERENEIVLSCHMIARAVAKGFNLKCVDGFFHPNFEHSWLVLPSGAVIDVYPIAIFGGPLMMAGGKYSITNNYYLPRSTRRISSKRFSKPSFRRSVRRIIKELKRTQLEFTF